MINAISVKKYFYLEEKEKKKVITNITRALISSIATCMDILNLAQTGYNVQVTK